MFVGEKFKNFHCEFCFLNKESVMSDMNINTNNMNEEEKGLLCSVINNLGSGQHPCADLNTLSSFRKKYVDKLLVKAESKLTPQGLELLSSIKEKI